MRRLAATTLVLFFGSVLALAQSVDALLRKAKDYSERKEYTLALETLGSLLSQDPKNAGALELKSQVLKLSAAAQAAARVEQIFVEAKTYHEAGQSSRAQKRLKELLALDPTHSEGQALMNRLELEGEMELLAEDQASSVKEGDFVDLDQVDQAPQLLVEAPPKYPEVARRMGIDGEVRVLATIDEKGSVGKIFVVRRIEGWDEINQEAEKAVMKYRFEPAKKDGVKVATIVNLSVVFRLGRDSKAPMIK